VSSAFFTCSDINTIRVSTLKVDTINPKTSWNTGEIAGNKPIALRTGSIISMHQVDKNDHDGSATATTWEDMSGYSITVTPYTVNSKFIIDGMLNLARTINSHTTLVRIVRVVSGQSDVVVGGGKKDTSGATYALNQSNYVEGAVLSYRSNGQSSTVYVSEPNAFGAIDDPDTTSAITYKLQWYQTGSTVYINRGVSGGNNAYESAASSYLKVTEIAG